jgi:monomeric sarcosine oxidase
MPHVVVVGAGVFGTWTAHHLRVKGASVTLIDAYGPASFRASSGDQSRILRCGYGADEIYSEFARRSLEQWRALEARAARLQVWHRCGVLLLAAADDPYVLATEQTLKRGGFAVEALDAQQLRTRYPHLEASNISVALLEPECGVLMARRAVRTLASELVRSGTPLVRGRALVAASGGGRLYSVRLSDGTDVAGDAFVFACGAWLPSVFPSTIGGRIRPTRQTVIYFGTPAGDARFGPARTPAWIDRPSGIYGVPELEDGGLKVGIDEHGPHIDPDSDDRTPSADHIVRARAWVERRFPAMKGAPIVGARVCQYENTSNGDLLIDRHPVHDNVWIVGGGSGHGFKHGPAVGEHAANLVLTGADTHPRFSLATKGTHAARAVF